MRLKISAKVNQKAIDESVTCGTEPAVNSRGYMVVGKNISTRCIVNKLISDIFKAPCSTGASTTSVTYPDMYIVGRHDELTSKLILEFDMMPNQSSNMQELINKRNALLNRPVSIELDEINTERLLSVKSIEQFRDRITGLGFVLEELEEQL